MILVLQLLVAFTAGVLVGVLTGVALVRGSDELDDALMKLRIAEHDLDVERETNARLLQRETATQIRLDDRHAREIARLVRRPYDSGGDAA